MKLLASVLLATLASTAAMASGTAGDAIAPGTCLRGDGIDRIKMIAADRAVATDRQGRRFDLVFTASCGVRHQNVFFVLHPEKLPLCIVPGSFFPTNREAACVVKSVTAQK